MLLIIARAEHDCGGLASIPSLRKCTPGEHRDGLFQPARLDLCKRGLAECDVPVHQRLRRPRSHGLHNLHAQPRTARACKCGARERCAGVSEASQGAFKVWLWQRKRQSAVLNPHKATPTGRRCSSALSEVQPKLRWQSLQHQTRLMSAAARTNSARPRELPAGARGVSRQSTSSVHRGLAGPTRTAPLIPRPTAPSTCSMRARQH